MQPDPKAFLDAAGIAIPPVGLYDAPSTAPFEPVVSPAPGKHVCLFAFYESWLEGKTALITREVHGCGGCGRQMFGVDARPKGEFIDFLYEQEGLKASRELMEAWIDLSVTYDPRNEFMLMGPLNPDQYENLLSITFFVDPDQLALMVYGAQYHAAPGDPEPVLAPFSSGCGQLINEFHDREKPQAVIGATDVAMRRFLPPDILAFTVTRKLFENLCSLDERSFLYKPFWRNLRKAREERVRKG